MVEDLVFGEEGVLGTEDDESWMCMGAGAHELLRLLK
jgi:hypothetical protein